LLNYGGYQAPPLDGVWATAPYFHNGSVPTIADVLDSNQMTRIEKKRTNNVASRIRHCLDAATKATRSATN